MKFTDISRLCDSESVEIRVVAVTALNQFTRKLIHGK